MSFGQLSWAPRSVWNVANGAMGLTAANASPAVRTRAANGCVILRVIASRRIARRRDGCNGRVVGFNATPSGISRLTHPRQDLRLTCPREEGPEADNSHASA